MTVKRTCTAETIRRAAENVKKRDLNNPQFKNPDLVGSISEEQVRSAFIRASRKLDAMTRVER